jgi:hypothetical protein
MLFDLQYCTELRLEHMPPGQQALTQNSTRSKEIYHEIMMSQEIQISLQNNVNSTLFPTYNPNTFLF